MYSSSVASSVLLCFCAFALPVAQNDDGRICVPGAKTDDGCLTMSNGPSKCFEESDVEESDGHELSVEIWGFDLLYSGIESCVVGAEAR